MTDIYSRRVHVTVERGPMEKIPTTIFAHEIPCMAIHHGEGSVQVVADLPEGLDYDKIGEPVKQELDEEWARLISKYGRHPDMNVSVAEYVFQGLKRNLQQACDELMDTATNHSSGVDEDQDGNMSRDEIKAKLDELDITYSKNATKPVLLQTLRDGICEVLEEHEVDYLDKDPIEVLYQLMPKAD